MILVVDDNFAIRELVRRVLGGAGFDVRAVASGKRSKSEIHGIGDEEFVPWTVGPTL